MIIYFIGIVNILYVIILYHIILYGGSNDRHSHCHTIYVIADGLNNIGVSVMPFFVFLVLSWNTDEVR